MSRSNIKPRLIQLPDVLTYLGVKKPFFDSRLRSRLTEVKLGYKTIAFEKDEVDRLIDSIKKGDSSCQTNYPQDSTSEKMELMRSTSTTAQAKGTRLSAYEKLLSPRQK